MRECGNCSGELLQVGTSDGFKQDVEQCQSCLTVWVTRDGGAKDPIGMGDLTLPTVVDGRFGPQFTAAERGLMAEALEAFIETVDKIRESGLFPEEVTASVKGRGYLTEFIERLRS